MTRTLLSLALLLLVATPAVAGKVYRWTDADGRVHYGDRAPPGVEATRRYDVPGHEPERFAELQVQRDPQQARVVVRNRLHGPIEVQLELTDAAHVASEPAMPLSTLLQGSEAREIARIVPTGAATQSTFELRMQAMPGDPRAMPEDVVYSLPVDERGFTLGQGFHGEFSHDDEQNRYAVDLVVPEGTPVLAAREGIVMQVESGFREAGSNRSRYADRANLIRVLHRDGTMALYAHLREDGVLVHPGQPVALGQHIGYSGNTGYSTGPHLHFALQVNTGMKLASLPFRMVGPRGFLPLGER
ncbi:MAG TPA: M23 family metallopeptidase [Arenimonas sp.]|nr:M23 family metallopeptidase [Arenimonas sp.]